MLQVQSEEQGFRVCNYSNSSCFSLICTNSKTAISLKPPTALAPPAFLDWPELSLMHESPSRGGVSGGMEFLGISVSASRVAPVGSPASAAAHPCAKLHQSCLTLCDTRNFSPPGSLSVGFSRQEYWRGLPLPPPGDLLDSGIKPASLMSPVLAGGFFATSTTLGCCTYKGARNNTALVTQMVKNLPAMQETWVRSLGWEDTLEKEMAMRSSVLAWRIPGTADPGGLPSMGLHRVGHD